MYICVFAKTFLNGFTLPVDNLLPICTSVIERLKAPLDSLSEHGKSHRGEPSQTIGYDGKPQYHTLCPVVFGQPTSSPFQNTSFHGSDLEVRHIGVK